MSRSSLQFTILAVPCASPGHARCNAGGVDKDKALIELEYATTFNRMHPLVSTVGELGLTEEQIDAMWAAALSL